MTVSTAGPALQALQRVTSTLLDLHRESIESARAIVESLDLDEFVAGFEVVNAGAYRIRQHEPPDVIMLEVMQACLESEPQVAVTRHLLRHQMEPRYQPMRFTEITVYRDHVLRDYDSGLSYPRQLVSRDAVGPGDTVRFAYQLGAHPRLVAERSTHGVEANLAAST